MNVCAKAFGCYRASIIMKIVAVVVMIVVIKIFRENSGKIILVKRWRCCKIPAHPVIINGRRQEREVLRVGFLLPPC